MGNFALFLVTLSYGYGSLRLFELCCLIFKLNLNGSSSQNGWSWSKTLSVNNKVDFIFKKWEFFLSVYNRRSARDRKQAKLAAATKTPPSSDGDGMTEGNNNNVDSSTTPPPPADQVLAKTAAHAASNGLIRFEEDEGGNAEADDTQESSQVRGLLILI